MNRFESATKPLRWFMALLLVAFVAGCSSGNGSPAATTAPTVSSTLPANAAIGIVLNANITATFSEAMDATTVTSATFTLKKQGTTTAILGTFTFPSTTTATFNPNGNLAAGTIYTATITTGVKDLAGNALAVTKTWSFTTGAAADNTAPTVSSTIPASAATGIVLNANITATFSKAMDAATINTATFTLKQGTTVVPGAVTYAGTTATFNPTSDLASNTIYTVTVTTGVKDLAGNALAANKTWSFTTAVDNTAPTVSSTIPADVATGIAVNANIAATFSEAMDAATVTATTFTLKQGTTPVPGVVTYVGTTATFNPTSNLANNTTYTAAVTTGVKDLAGNALAVTKTWGFTTVATGAAGPQPVDLGTAGNFVILAKSGISTVPSSAVTGDIGVSPIDQTAITGFSEAMDPSTTFSTSPQVTGKIYAADYTEPTPTNLTTAVGDMQTAFTDAAGRTLPDQTELGGGDISGMTLTPGLYKWGTAVLINAGGSPDTTGVTLDCQGNANSVFIFQIAQDLTVSNGAIVTLIGSCQAKNIFWQVSGQAILGTTVQFKGIILSQTLISLNTGAVLIGRALAQTAVTLDSNTVTAP